MQRRVLLSLFIALTGTAASAIIYGKSRWQRSTTELRHRLDRGRVRCTTILAERELEELPTPVQRYFRAVLKGNGRRISTVVLEHEGTFNMSERGEQWKPFKSKQHVVTRRVGFVWDARIRIAPGVPVYVHDAYVAGEGILHGALLGLLTVADMRGSPEIAEGELMRFLAEAAWYPTALLPGDSVRWQPIDNNAAEAVLNDGATSVTLLFRFNDAGLIESVYADSRNRTVNGRLVPTPWEGRWQKYAMWHNVLVPLEGEVAWLAAEGRQPYWRGRITNIQYEFD